MADIPQLLANYDALVGVALGAGLAYGFGALNRRHQEAREDQTRWYEARLKAYAEFSGLMATFHRTMAFGPASNVERVKEQMANMKQFMERVEAVTGALRLVASQEVIEESGNVCGLVADVAFELSALAAKIATMDDPRSALAATTKIYDDSQFSSAIVEFERAARKDLGHPSP
jgi:hypothetical protein